MHFRNGFVQLRYNVQHMGANYAVERICGDIVRFGQIRYDCGLGIGIVQMEDIHFAHGRTAKAWHISGILKLQTMASDVSGELVQKLF
jgi:hypothetical protein